MSWGKVHSDNPWWGNEGIYSHMYPTEFMACVYLTALCGSKREPTGATVEQIRQAIQGSAERTRKALQTLRRLNLFEVSDRRDDRGHIFRRYKPVPPEQWNQAELMIFLVERKGKAVKLSYDRSERAAETGVLMKGDPRKPEGQQPSQNEGVAGLADRGGSHPRKPYQPGPANCTKPVPHDARSIEEVEKEEERTTGSASAHQEPASPHPETIQGYIDNPFAVLNILRRNGGERAETIEALRHTPYNLSIEQAEEVVDAVMSTSGKVISA